MTKIRQSGDSSMIEDRRSQGGGGGGGLNFPGLGGGGGGGGFPIPMKMGGGLIGILLMLAVVVLPKLLHGSGLGGGTTSSNGGNSAPINVPSPNAVPAGDSGGGQSLDTGSQGTGACDTDTAQIVCGAVTDVQNFWDATFKTAGRNYTFAHTVFFSGGTDTGCGQASAQTGPFYCPVDSKVYFDLDFLVQLQDRFGATGDLASQYIVAHEYGHHIQKLLGISDQVHQAEQQDPGSANQMSVKLELQADCLAGVWANDANRRGQFDSNTEISEAINAAGAVGDDKIQQQTQGRVDPESFTHGSAQQRMTWFKRGFDTGNSDNCDTFSE